MQTNQFAKQLRQQMTEAEKVLWRELRAHRFGKTKFRRQQKIGSYVVDFICFEAKLIIEADGGQHGETDADTNRDRWFASQGFRVLRFWNHDILQRTENVLDEIWRQLGLN